LKTAMLTKQRDQAAGFDQASDGGFKLTY
jgi:hypothetical protein